MIEKFMDLEKVLAEFMKRKPMTLMKQYRILKLHGDIQKILDDEERRNGFARTLTESENSERDYDSVRVYPPEVTVAAMKEILGNNADDWIRIETFANEVKIVVIVPDLAKNVQLVVDVMEKAGYFIAANDIRPVSELRWRALLFEPYHSIDIADEIYDYDCPIIHATPTKNLPSIMKHGIVASHKNKRYNYPSRIYFLFSDQDHVGAKQVQAFVNKLAEVSGESDYTLLYIDVRKLPEGMHFYNDPFQPSAFYTYQEIPASAIQKTGKVNRFSPYI